MSHFWIQVIYIVQLTYSGSRKLFAFWNPRVSEGECSQFLRFSSRVIPNAINPTSSYSCSGTFKCDGNTLGSLKEFLLSFHGSCACNRCWNPRKLQRDCFPNWLSVQHSLIMTQKKKSDISVSKKYVRFSPCRLFTHLQLIG